MSSDTTTTSRDFLAHYRPIAEQVERYAWYLTRSTDDVAELTQATIVEVLHGWDRIRDAAALHAYCLSVMTRLHVRERARRGDTIAPIGVQPSMDSPTPSAPIPRACTTC